jgi:hypothetical protein
MNGTYRNIFSGEMVDIVQLRHDQGLDGVVIEYRRRNPVTVEQTNTRPRRIWEFVKPRYVFEQTYIKTDQGQSTVKLPEPKQVYTESYS